MLQVWTIIAPLFLIILLSALLQKFGKLGEDWERVLNEYALKIGMPALIFLALAQANLDFAQELSVVIANLSLLLFWLSLVFVAKLLFKLRTKTFLTLLICTIFGNVAYLGVPITTRLYGGEALPEVSLIIAIYLIVIFMGVVSVLDYSVNPDKKTVVTQSLKNMALNPLLLAVAAGFLVQSLNLSIPVMITTALNMIQASVTPVVLMVIGLFIGRSEFGHWREWLPVLGFSLVTLLLFPASFLLGLNTLNLNTDIFLYSVILAAMPLAITPFALADKYQLDKTFIARSIVLSTVISVFTIPFWVSLV